VGGGVPPGPALAAPNARGTASSATTTAVARSRGDATSGALDVVADVRPQQRLLELARDLRELRERLGGCLACVGFFWRIMGATIVSKKAASRSSKCLYMVRCRGSTPYRKKSFTMESTM